MIRKLYITLIFAACGMLAALGQVIDPSTYGSYSDLSGEQQQDSVSQEETAKREKVVSVIRNWKLASSGAELREAVLDTLLDFYQVYDPIFRRSISNIHSGNFGGPYQSNDFFARKPDSDFYFYRSFDAYALFPASVLYFNTTTPYTLLDYSQSENKNIRTESRFNAFHAQNVSPELGFDFAYRQGRSMGQYQLQETNFHTVSLNVSYVSGKFNSHVNLLFNKHENQENGGLLPGQDLNEFEETEAYRINLNDASSEIDNTTFFVVNEYKVGKTEEKEAANGDIYDAFRPITGFIHQFEYSANKRIYNDAATGTFYANAYLNSARTGDTTAYQRITNIFQLKFYEAPERKFTFTQRAFIGFEAVAISMPDADAAWMKWKDDKFGVYVPLTADPSFTIGLQKINHQNLFVGGGLSRTEGSFWKWDAQGKIYLTGYRSGQTELNAFIEKPLRIGKDTTTLRVEGELNTRVPDYFEQYFNSNHFRWNNTFNNTKEMVIRGKIHSQRYRFTLGLNYALISGYIYNGDNALPSQGNREMLVLGAYANKDVSTRHLLFRTNLLWQKSTEQDYLSLPDFTGYLSLAYKTIISKVLHTNLGFDVRYYTAFRADAYDPATGRFYRQNDQTTGNYPVIDLYANLKLKRTRAFFQLKNAGSGIIPGDFWAAPDYPLYRRTFRLGIAWSFYD